jgi:hypothetical protein
MLAGWTSFFCFYLIHRESSGSNLAMNHRSGIVASVFIVNRISKEYERNPFKKIYRRLRLHYETE